MNWRVILIWVLPLFCDDVATGLGSSPWLTPAGGVIITFLTAILMAFLWMRMISLEISHMRAKAVMSLATVIERCTLNGMECFVLWPKGDAPKEWADLKTTQLKQSEAQPK